MTRPALVVMGVAGSGKSAVGTRLAEALSVPFVEGDRFHSPASVAKMAAGTPLTDDDRQGWLLAIAAQLAAAREHGRGVVVSCSALKRQYRDLLRTGDPAVRFVFLHGATSLLRQRLDDRRGHYMSAAMLDSQLAILEAPAADEQAWSFDVRQSPAEIVSDIMARAKMSGREPTT